MDKKNGVKGYKISGKGTYSEASIFLPATGYVRRFWGQSIYGSGSYAYYWSSSPDGNYYSTYALYFETSVFVTSNYEYCDRSNGMPIRPVSYSTK